MPKPMTAQEFFKLFPDDDVCLEHLFKTRFGEEVACDRCGEIGKFRKLAKLPAYTCNCGNHIHPMVGTPFMASRTPLQKWFYAMYLFTTSRHGVPAKELQRQLGVTYKCAWRIGHEIRKYMGKIDGDFPLGGNVEADETYVGGKRRGKRGRGALGKTTVFGMLAREGDVMSCVVTDAKGKTLQPIIECNVTKGSTIHTDEWLGYRGLNRKGFKHRKVNHGKGQYVKGISHTNSIEGFWSQLKRSINGTHIHVSGKHLPKYLGEFEFRYNMRKAPHLMFPALLGAF